MPPRPDVRQPALQTAARTPPEILRAPGTTVHAQIEDWLAGQISAGRLVPGDRLAAEQDLAAWFGVSRMTLRHALGELARRGLVTKAVGRRGGTFVAAPKLEQDLTTLAGFSEQLRRGGMVAGARVLTATQRPASPAAAAALGMAADDLVVQVRRLRLADGKPIAVEHSQFPAAQFPGLLGCPVDGSLYCAVAGRDRAGAARAPPRQSRSLSNIPSPPRHSSPGCWSARSMAHYMSCSR